MENETVLKIEHLTVNYGNTPALSDICLEVKKGDFLAIIGPNGGGKSTLLKSVLGLIPIHSGTIETFGKTGRPNKTGYVPQFSYLDRKFPITVRDAVLTGMLKKGLHPFYMYSQPQKEKADECLELLRLENLSKRQISDLSGGEFQRLLIARALASDPELLLLDEPTASVDPTTREHIYSLLDGINDRITVLLVTHDTLAVSSRVKTIACLNRTLVYHGEPSLSAETMEKIYGCPVDLIAHGTPHRVLGVHGCDCGKDRGAVK